MIFNEDFNHSSPDASLLAKASMTLDDQLTGEISEFGVRIIVNLVKQF